MGSCRSAMERANELGQKQVSTELLRRIDGARWVRFDKKRRLVYVWFGGHGVEVFDLKGKAVSFWNVGSFVRAEADFEDVRESIEEAIETGDLP